MTRSTPGIVNYMMLTDFDIEGVSKNSSIQPLHNGLNLESTWCVKRIGGCDTELSEMNHVHSHSNPISQGPSRFCQRTELTPMNLKLTFQTD